MKRLPALLLVAAVTLAAVTACKKADRPADSGPESRKELVSGPNVRKNGSVEVRTDDIDKTRESIRALALEYQAGILTENVAVAADSSRVLTVRLKVRSERFTALLDRAAALGRLLDQQVEAEDVSDELAELSSAIELLTARLEEARKKNDARLVDELSAQLAAAKKERANTGRSTRVSYLTITARERVSVAHALSFGVEYGRQGFVWMIKAVMVLLIAGIPALAAYLLLRLIVALAAWRWRRLIAAIERLGGRRD